MEKKDTKFLDSNLKIFWKNYAKPLIILVFSCCYPIMWFSVFLIDGFTMRPCSYTFYSSMSDDELDDTFTQVEGRLNFLKNLNSK